MRLERAILALLLAGAACTAEGPEAGPAQSPSPDPPSPSPSPNPSPEAPVARHRFWVAVEDAHEVVLVDFERRRVVRRFSLSGPPHNLTVVGDAVVTAMQGNGRIALLKGRRVTEVDLGGSPHDVKGAGELIVVANEGAARVDLVDTEGRVLGSIPLEANPHDLAKVPGLDTVWVTLDGTDEIAIVDLALRQVEGHVATERRPHDILFPTASHRAWVTDWGGDLHVFDLNGALAATVPLGVEAHHLAFTPDGREAWITDHGAHAVYVVANPSLKVLATLPIHGAPHHVAISPDGRFATVADHDNGSLVIFNVEYRRVIATIPVGPGPHGVWAAPR